MSNGCSYFGRLAAILVAAWLSATGPLSLAEERLTTAQIQCVRALTQTTDDQALDEEAIIDAIAILEKRIRGENLYSYLTQLERLTDQFLSSSHGQYGQIFSKLVELESQMDVLRLATSKPQASGAAPVGHVDYSKQGLRDSKALQPYLYAKLMDFTGAVENQGIMALLHNHTENNWHFEQLYKGLYREGAYSVRLNHGYRVVFVKLNNTDIEIINIDKTTTHFN